MTLLGVAPAAYGGPDDPIDIPDPALLACVNAAIDTNRAADEDVTEAEAAGITSLYCVGKDVGDLAGLEHLVGVEVLNLLNNDGLDDVSPLGGLPILQKLYLGETGVTDVSPLGSIGSLEVLNLTRNGITDVSSLGNLSSLRRLFLQGNDISDLSSLSGLDSLDELNLRENQVTGVAPLSGLTSLRRLDLAQNRISDASDLSGLTADIDATGQSVDLGDLIVGVAEDNPVVGLDGDPVELAALYDTGTNSFTPTTVGSGSVGWSDGAAFSGTLSFNALEQPVLITIPDDALRGCVNGELGQGPDDPITEAQAASITTLNCVGDGVRDLTGAEHLTGLQKLYLSDNNITDVGPLANLTSLQTLALNNNDITDVSDLVNLDSLQFLALSATGVTDVSPLANLASLLSLSLLSNDISDVSDLGSMTSLQWLYLDDNDISDVSPLANLTSLEWLTLDDNDISDVSDLAGLTSMWELQLERNSVTDLSALDSLDSATIRAEEQSVDLGALVVSAAEGNPVVGLDGDPVELDELYDAGTNTLTPTTLGADSVGWSDGALFSGTLSFTVVEAADPGGGDGEGDGGDGPGNGDGGADRGNGGDGADPGNGDDGDGTGNGGDDPGNRGDGNGNGNGVGGDDDGNGGKLDSSGLPATGVELSTVTAVGVAAAVLLLAGGLLVGLARRRRA